MPHYTYRINWSAEENLYIGSCLEFPERYSRAPTAPAAVEAIELLVGERVAEMIEDGVPLPPSVADRRFRGTFVVRTSPELHSRLVVEAAEQRVSLNQWVVQKLSGRQATLSLDDLF